MFNVLLRSILMTFALASVFCGFYPLVVTGVAKAFFAEKAAGNLVQGREGRVVGARLIGQNFTRPEYFHGRPSAAVDANGFAYDAANSAGSNLGPTSQKLVDQLRQRVEVVLRENPSLKSGQIPVDMVTTSASGLDPHISPAHAWAQVERVAHARGVPVAAIRAIVDSHLEGPQLALFGEPVVNVLLINLELDRRFAR